MTLIEVIASGTFIEPGRRTGHVLSAMSKKPGRADADGPFGLEKHGLDRITDHRTNFLVNGSIAMVPKVPEVGTRGPIGDPVCVPGDSTSLPQDGVIKISNGPGQEDTGETGNTSYRPTGSEGSQTSARHSNRGSAHNTQSNDCLPITNNASTGDNDHVLERSENGDFPGDGSESGQLERPVRKYLPPPLDVSSLTTAVDSLGELSAVDASELLDRPDRPPDSPATIDVTEIPQLETGPLQRPSSFGSDTCLGDSCRTEAQDQRTAMVRESPIRVPPVTPTASVPVLPISKPSDSPSHGGNPVDYVDGVVRSRAGSDTSQSSSVAGETDFVEVNLQGQAGPRNVSVVGAGAKPKKKGLSGFLAKNLFRKSSRGTDAAAAGDNAPSWGLFGQTPPASPSRTTDQLAAERQQKGHTHPPTSSNSWKSRKSGMRHASSTTALILEDRPSYLPAKDPEERQKHHEEYDQMVQGAKKKELKSYKKQLKDLGIRLKHEDGIQLHLQTWKEEILPNWETMRNNKKTKDLWWQGIPPSIRGRVWMLAIGNELNITPELFEIFLLRAKDRIKYISGLDSDEEDEEANAGSREDSVDVIKLDVARTFPHLCIFQKGGPFYEPLHSVLGAYACYRPDVGYLQGMSFIAAVFLLYLDPPLAFHCFANLLNKSCLLAFFRLDQQVMKSYFNAYEEYFQLYMPRLYRHFQEQNLRPDIYILDWIFTLYIKTLPLDVACVVLDVFFRDGEEFLFRTALGILKHFEEVLLQLDFIQVAQFLCKLPPNLTAESLLQSIALIDMHNQRKFKEVLAVHLAQSLTTS